MDGPLRRVRAGLRVALVAPPMKSVPPVGYGGTERVVASIASGLVAHGHDVTVFASGDSQTAGTLVPIVPTALWDAGYRGDVSTYMEQAGAAIWRESDRFDIIHSHLENFGFLMARYCPTPVVSTLHGRLDVPGLPELLHSFPEIPLVAISANQRRWMPDLNWVGTVHHGLPLESMPHDDRPGSYLVVVGRIAPEKGITEAVELSARSGIPLRIAAKVHRPEEHQLFESVVKPAIDGGSVEFLGELQAGLRDPLLAGAMATLMLGSWPEPFGLVAIESLATGTPVIARHAGALPEIIEHGVDGFLVDDVTEARLALERVAGLDRALIRERALARFSTDRMTTAYEAVYERVLAANGSSPKVFPSGFREPRSLIARGDAAPTWRDAGDPVAGVAGRSQVAAAERARRTPGGPTRDPRVIAGGGDGASRPKSDGRP